MGCGPSFPKLCGYSEAYLMAMGHVEGLLLLSACVAVQGPSPFSPCQQVHRGIFAWFSQPALAAVGKQAPPMTFSTWGVPDCFSLSMLREAKLPMAAYTQGQVLPLPTLVT